MRTTLDLPDPILRTLKVQAARSGKSLKALLNELILRAMAMPATSEFSKHTFPPELPVLSRLIRAVSEPKSNSISFIQANSQFDNPRDLELQDDLEKLRRSGFIQ